MIVITVCPPVYSLYNDKYYDNFLIIFYVNDNGCFIDGQLRQRVRYNRLISIYLVNLFRYTVVCIGNSNLKI